MIMKLLMIFLLSCNIVFAERAPSNRAPAIPGNKKVLTLQEELQYVLDSSKEEKEDKKAVGENPQEDFVEDSISLGQSGLMKKPLSLDEQRTLDSIEKSELPDPLKESDYFNKVEPVKKLRKRSR